MQYVVTIQPGSVVWKKVVKGSFACTSAELAQEIATAAHVKIDDILRIELFPDHFDLTSVMAD